MKLFKIRTMLVSMLCFSSSFSLSHATQQILEPAQLLAAGSGVNLGITRLLADAFSAKFPQVMIEIPGSIGSKGAIKAAVGGAVTFGLISRNLSAEEKALGLTDRPYAKVPIVIGAHPTVKDTGITSQELVAIFKGTKTQWQDGNEIIVQMREQWDSGFGVLQNEIPGFKEAHSESLKAKRWLVYFTDQEANQALAKTPYAIGVSDLGMVSTEQLNLRVLALNGVVPNPDNLLNGTYPLSRELIFIYRAEGLSPAARAFLDFVSSKEGSTILRANGYLPLE